MEPDVRDEVVDYVRHWSERTGIAAQRLVGWMELARSKFYDWRERYGRLNEHNAWVPRDHWLERWEKEAIVAFHEENPEEGYRRLTYLNDRREPRGGQSQSRQVGIYRVLSEAGRLRRWKGKESLKGTGFVQPVGPHESRRVGSTRISVI